MSVMERAAAKEVATGPNLVALGMNLRHLTIALQLSLLALLEHRRESDLRRLESLLGPLDVLIGLPLERLADRVAHHLLELADRQISDQRCAGITDAKHSLGTTKVHQVGRGSGSRVGELHATRCEVGWGRGRREPSPCRRSHQRLNDAQRRLNDVFRAHRRRLHNVHRAQRACGAGYERPPRGYVRACRPLKRLSLRHRGQSERRLLSERRGQQMRNGERH